MKRTVTEEMKSHGKVFWTDTEKLAVIKRAAQIHAERPDLAGLPLIREAMMVLPPGRRRKVIALTQVSWFEGGLVEELRRQAEMRRESDPLITVTRLHHRTIEEWVREDVTWKAKVLAMQDQMIALLVQILGETQALNSVRDNQMNTPKTNGKPK